MPLADLPLDQLRDLILDESAPEDLLPFWVDTIDRARQHPLVLARERVENHLVLSQTWELTFSGFEGQPIRAWLQLPNTVQGPIPTVVQFHGYSTTRTVPLGSTWVEAGYAHLQLDIRGQGWSSASIHDLTPDWGPDAGANAAPGLMTRGVQSPQSYYFGRLMTDAVRLVEVAASLDELDSERITLTGGSQGGGLTIAAAGICAMVGVPVMAAMPDVPFLCSFRRGVDVATAGPYQEIEAFLRARPHEGDQLFSTLAYFDGVHLAAHATCPALFSVALRDPVCPPSTVFPAYNAWGGDDKQIEVYPWNEHEGGREIQLWKQVQWLSAR